MNDSDLKELATDWVVAAVNSNITRELEREALRKRQRAVAKQEKIGKRLIAVRAEKGLGVNQPLIIISPHGCLAVDECGVQLCSEVVG